MNTNIKIFLLCPVPDDQKPINEYIGLKENPVTNWTMLAKKNYDAKLFQIVGYNFLFLRNCPKTFTLRNSFSSKASTILIEITGGAPDLILIFSISCIFQSNLAICQLPNNNNTIKVGKTTKVGTSLNLKVKK